MLIYIYRNIIYIYIFREWILKIKINTKFSTQKSIKNYLLYARIRISYSMVVYGYIMNFFRKYEK